MALGRCGVCGTRVKINKNGQLRAHQLPNGDGRCPGSHGDPSAENAVLPDAHEVRPDEA